MGSQSYPGVHGPILAPVSCPLSHPIPMSLHHSDGDTWPWGPGPIPIPLVPFSHPSPHPGPMSPPIPTSPHCSDGDTWPWGPHGPILVPMVPSQPHGPIPAPILVPCPIPSPRHPTAVMDTLGLGSWSHPKPFGPISPSHPHVTPLVVMGTLGLGVPVPPWPPWSHFPTPAPIPVLLSPPIPVSPHCSDGHTDLGLPMVPSHPHAPTPLSPHGSDGDAVPWVPSFRSHAAPIPVPPPIPASPHGGGWAPQQQSHPRFPPPMTHSSLHHS